MKKLKNKNGFTLIELIMVMIILGVLSAVAIPRYLDTIEKALHQAQSGLHDVVRVRVFLTSPDHVPAVSSVLKQRVGFTRPANTTVCTALAVPECLVEIEVEARLGSGTPQ